MIPAILTHWKPILAAVVVASAFLSGLHVGGLRGAADVANLQREQAEATASLNRRLVRLSNDLSEKAAALVTAQEAQAALAKEIEDEAAADGADMRRPSAASLRRLERRWANGG